MWRISKTVGLLKDIKQNTRSAFMCRWTKPPTTEEDIKNKLKVIKMRLPKNKVTKLSNLR